MNSKFNKKIIFLFLALTFVVSVFVLIGSNYLDLILKDQIDNIPKISELIRPPNSDINLTIFIILEVIAISLLILPVLISKKSKVKYGENTVRITDKIEIPKPSKKSQYGTSWFLDKKKFDEEFKYHKITSSAIKKADLKSGGIVLGCDMNSSQEKIYYVDDDTHSITIGATRSGKSRTIVLQTIGLQGLSGESMVVSDPKGELFCYTSKYLKDLGYEVLTIDFEEPEKSSSYNFLQNVIDLVNDGDLNRAIDAVEDIVQMLVGQQVGEPIWYNGECSILAFAILYIVIENKDNPQYQNLTNVYHFISKTCKSDEKGRVPLNDLLDLLPDKHPAKAKAGISMVAPSKTRGSFFTSALSTLRLFSNPLIYEMSKETEFDSKNASRKRAIFIIVPDQKETYYKLASLFVSQYYNLLVESAKKQGNRLPKRVNFNLDEFGNYPEIVGMSSKMTVGGGYGIRFNLFLQSFSQLEKVYGKETSTTLRDNAETLIYLKSNNHETLEEISKRLGTYTALNVTESLNTGGSYSSSTSYIQRPLLTSEEVGNIERPNTLVITPSKRCIFYAPDLTKYQFNKLFGMGDKEHNTKIIEDRQNSRYKKDSKKIKVELMPIREKTLKEILEEQKLLNEQEIYDEHNVDYF